MQLEQDLAEVQIIGFGFTKNKERADEVEFKMKEPE